MEPWRPFYSVYFLTSYRVPALKELGRVVKTGGLIRLLEYVRPHQTVRRILARLWEPWIASAYGASFDRGQRNMFPRPASRSLTPALWSTIS